MSQIIGKHIEVEGGDVEVQPETRKPYTKPTIVHELELETRAGSPLGMPDPMDPLGLLEPKH